MIYYVYIALSIYIKQNHSLPPYAAFLASSSAASAANLYLSFSANFSNISFSNATLYSMVISLLLILVRCGTR